MNRTASFFALTLSAWIILGVVIRPPVFDDMITSITQRKVVEDTSTYPDVYAVREVPVDIGLLTWWEGNTSEPVVPSDMSGPTISMGLDLGTAGPELITRSAKKCVDPSTLAVMLSANGLRGPRASAWCRKYELRISDQEKLCIASSLVSTILDIIKADSLMQTAPIEVKTAAVSFVMATGRPGLILPFIARNDWSGMASFIGSFHNDWSGPERSYFVKRRKLEADLISLAINNKTVKIDPD